MATVRGRDYLLMGADAGHITPAGKLGGGGSFTQNVTFQLAAPTDNRTQDQIAARVAFEGQRATRRNGG